MTDKVFAILNSGSVVVNLIVWDGNTANWKPPIGHTAVEVPAGTFCSIEYRYQNGTFAAPGG